MKKRPDSDDIFCEERSGYTKSYKEEEWMEAGGRDGGYE